MDPFRLQALLRRACWACLGLLLLGSLAILAAEATYEVQPLAWAGAAALAFPLAARVLVSPRATEDHLGAALLALAGCGAMAALASPPLALGALGAAIAWGTLLLVWHQLATIYLEVQARAAGLDGPQAAALVRAAVARLWAVGRATVVVLALSVVPPLFAAFPLVAGATLAIRLLLLAALLGTAAALYLGLAWQAQRRETPGKSG